MAGEPEYAEYLGKLLALKQKYHKFFYGGRFVCDTDLALPAGVKYYEYVAGDGERMFAVWNGTGAELTFDVCGHSVTLGAGQVTCVVK